MLQDVCCSCVVDFIGKVLSGQRDQQGFQEGSVLELGLYTRHVLPLKGVEQL